MKNPVFIQNGSGTEVPHVLTGLNHQQRRLTERRLSKKQRKTQVLRTVTLEDIPPGSLMSEESLAAIQRGEWTFAKEIPKPSTQLSAKERARLGRFDRLARMPVETVTVESCPVPWLPLITPITQSERDRLQAEKRAARKARRR